MSRIQQPHPDRLRHVHFRLWQISICAVVILVTSWSYTLHLAIGLGATFLAKHILVAVLAAGLDLPHEGDE